MNHKLYSLILIALVAFFNFTALGITFPLLSSMLFTPGFDILHVEATQTDRSFWLSLLLGALPLTQLLSAPLFGSLSDSYGRKKMLLYTQFFGLLAYALGAIAVLTQEIHLILVSRILTGISSGWSAIQGAVISDIATRRQKLEYFGYLGMASGLGFAIGPYIGGRLLEASFASFNPYLLPFVVALVCNVANMLLIHYRFEETLQNSKTNPNPLAKRLLKAKALLSNPLFVICFSVVFLFYFGWSFYWNFSPVLWIAQHAFGPKDISHMYSYGSIAFAICSGLFIHPLVKRFQVSSILFYALLLLSVSFICLLIIPSTLELLFLVPLQQYFLSLFTPSIATILSTHTGPNDQGEIMGIYQSVHAIGDALGPLVSAPLMSYHLASPLLVGAICMIAACTIIKKLLEKRLCTTSHQQSVY